MRVLFINNATTHYYNRVLSRLGQAPGVELKLLVPSQVSRNIGEGVYQTRDGLTIPVLELPEYNLLGRYSSFRGLASLLLRERPDIVIMADTYRHTFLFNLPVRAVRKLLGVKLIMKSIPFGIPTFDAARSDARGIARLPGWLNALLLRTGALRLLRRAALLVERASYALPDAHVNYIDAAVGIFGSYGVPPEKVFVTRNSPDTDLLIAVRESLAAEPPLLPPHRHRLVHVGRLVAWKRVDLLLRALARVRAEYPDAELLVIGSGPEAGALKSLGAELGLSGAVRFLGGIYDPRLLGGYLRACALYVLAGMGGLSINEAMCFGLPIVCSVGDGTERVLVRDGVNGKYFKDGDVDDLVKQILFLFGRPGLLERMGEASAAIIRDEVNIHTVIDGYVKAMTWVRPRDAGGASGASRRRAP